MQIVHFEDEKFCCHKLHFNPTALRKAKIVCNFGHSEFNRVKVQPDESLCDKICCRKIYILPFQMTILSTVMPNKLLHMLFLSASRKGDSL